MEKEDQTPMNCANCGKAILDEESSFCGYCGNSYDSKPKSSDLATEAGMLAIVAAAFSIAVGAIGILYYQSYTAYYASYGLDASASIGFLLYAGFAFVSSVFGIVGGIWAIGRKRFNFSVIGILLMLASAFFTFIAVWRCEFGFTESIMLSGIPIIVLSLTGAILLVKSKETFPHYTPHTESSDFAK